jgi:uncharacterized membrane protein
MKVKKIYENAASLLRIRNFLIILTILGCASRFFLLGRESLWLDEAVSLESAGRAASLHLENWIFFSGWEDPHPIFYYLVLHLWTRLVGASETALRGLSAVFGVLLVVCTYHIGRKLISKEAGMIAAMLLLLNPVAVYYSQEARMYTLIPLLIILSSYYFCELLAAPGKKQFILYVLFSVLLIYTDYLGTLTLLVHSLYLLLRMSSTSDRRRMGKVFFAYPAILLLYTPWMANAFLRLNWQMIAWIEPPGLSELVTVALHLLGIGFTNPDVPISLSGFSLRSVSYVLLGIWGSLFIFAGLLISLKEGKTGKTLLGMLCFVPLIIAVISMVRVPIFNLRQASVYLPEMALMMAVGVLAIVRNIPERLQRMLPYSGWSLSLLAPLLLVGILNICGAYLSDTKEDWRTLARDMEEIDDGRPIYICEWYMVEPFKYYYGGTAKFTGIRYEDVPLLESSDTEELVFIVSHIDPSSVTDILASKFHVQAGRSYRGPRVYFLRWRS